VNESTLENVLIELEGALPGRRFGKVFQLAKFQIAVDLRLDDSRYLFISVEPSEPRIYLIQRKLKELEKRSQNTSPFVSVLRKYLSGAIVETIEKVSGERILQLTFSNEGELGNIQHFALAIQLTGRSANLFLLNETGRIIDSMRNTFGEGQERGEIYASPKRPAESKPRTEKVDPVSDAETSPSARLDAFYLAKEAERSFQSRADAARKKVRQEISKREKLVQKLNGDLEHRGDAEKWKRFGDLILANIATARRNGNKITVTDFFDDAVPEIEIEAEEDLSLTEAAEAFFKRYTKARNAAVEISKRLKVLNSEIGKLKAESDRLEAAIAEKDEHYFAPESAKNDSRPQRKAGKEKESGFIGARSFTSSDGFEILVGKKAKDNDYLTFRVAKSLDLWLHAADYPGSHVVVRNPSRKEIPQTTLLEAAQLAAFYSDAREQPKAAVHYTQKKFVNKPRGAAPGLVSLASFKTILVEPKVGAQASRLRNLF
jgi:predicted ribosome quality control (RQC) complex YloA/Tae2 family protein